ncbi:MAG: hypothetical protein O2954_20370 [bacterium]|nr:hypothetical protein [bacterium]
MLKLATFTVDCTPLEGSAIGFGTDDSSATIRDSLFLRGFLFDNGKTRCLIASLDYCGLMNSAYDHLTGALADAVGIPHDHAVVHCVHQHDTPLLNFELEPLLETETFSRTWWQETVTQCATAAASAQEQMADVSEIGTCETRLHGFASNRRILGPDGKVRGMRFSRCGDASLRAEPVGTIDPFLRTLAFKGTDGNLLASMSFYATHPQVSNGRNTYSADAQGEAMRLLGETHSNALHAYFSGPFGNITAGKYSSPTDKEGNLLTFGKRLADGITRNLNGLDWHTPDTLEWTASSFPFPKESLDTDALRDLIRNPNTPAGQRMIKAAVLSSYEYEPNVNYPIRLLRLGPFRMLFLSGEPFVEYQLYIQSLIPDEFIAVAANCNDNFLYLPLAENFPQDGYEVTSFRWCTEEFEPRLKEAVSQLLLPK